MADGARTRDLLDHNQALCRLSYSHHVRYHRNESVLYPLLSPHTKLESVHYVTFEGCAEDTVVPLTG